MNNENIIVDDTLDASLEQRADYIPVDKLFEETADGSDLFNAVRKALLSPSFKTIVGPRGCGKTHMMRHAWLTCQFDDSKPFAIYVSFNKYYRLEPLLVSRASPPDEFHAWSLGLIILATFSTLRFNLKDSERNDCEIFIQQLSDKYGFPEKKLESLIASLERNQPLSNEEQLLCKEVQISKVIQMIDSSCFFKNRKRAILLLDDAALTLTPPYLIELLDIIKALKTTTIAPKASVYPGTTEYGPRFHTGQDSTPTFVWLSVEAEEYAVDMDEIARKRINNFNNIPDDVIQMIRFSSFGIPRAYLTMLQEYNEGGGKTQQQKLNQVIESHFTSRIEEFRSLATKVPKFKNLISVGEMVLDGMVNAIKISNTQSSLLQLVVGINKDEISSILNRMFQLLIEAGLIFDAKEVKHGTPERIYKRFIPHGAALFQKRALISGDSGGTIRGMVESLNLKRTKHPIRKKLEKLVVQPDEIKNIGFSLPPCPKCSHPRLDESQKFCTNCGSQLILVSTFDTCLAMRIENVPGLTQWQRSRIQSQLVHLNTIRDFLAMQDPVAELLTVYGFGRTKSSRIADLLQSFVDDFLS